MFWRVNEFICNLDHFLVSQEKIVSHKNVIFLLGVFSLTLGINPEETNTYNTEYIPGRICSKYWLVHLHLVVSYLQGYLFYQIASFSELRKYSIVSALNIERVHCLVAEAEDYSYFSTVSSLTQFLQEALVGFKLCKNGKWM